MEKEELKELAKIFREAADVIDEILENTDQEREEELVARFMVKMMKLQKMQ